MKPKLVYLLFFLTVCLTACGSDNDTPVSPELTESTVFFDDFTSFDNNVWTKETHEAGWTNQELQSYSPSQVSIGKDGNRSVLIITAQRLNGKIVSGRINSKNKKSFKYGKIEASIKLPSTANGLWPAFWMMGDNNNEWPACGEIDIMEMGDAQGIADGTSAKRVNTAIHYGPDVAAHEQQYFAGNANVNLQDGNYHTYSLDWNETNLKISIDGIAFHSFDITTNQYFHSNFYMLLNLAVGGSFTGITDVNNITAIKEGQKVAMYVDWIKIAKQN